MIIIIQLWLLGIIIIILLLLLISNIFVFFFFASSSNKVSLNWFTWFSWWNVDADCYFINRLIWHPWIWDHMTLTFKINAAIYWLSLGTSIQESIEVIPIGFHCAWAQVHGFKQKLEIENLKKLRKRFKTTLVSIVIKEILIEFVWYDTIYSTAGVKYN